MFKFIRDLNTIYADEKPGNEIIGSRWNLNDLPVQFIDNSQELKGLNKKQYSKSKTKRKNQRGAAGVSSWAHSSNGEEYANSATNESGKSGRKKVYSKRNMAEYDNPEIVAFLDDRSYDLFKDISTGTESICQEDNFELGRYIFSSILNSDSESCDSTKETLEKLSCIANDLTSMEQDDCKHEKHITLESLLFEDADFDQEDYVLIDNPTKKFVNENHLSEEEAKGYCDNEQHDYKRWPKEEEDDDFEGREKIVRAIQLIIGVQKEEEEAALSKPQFSSRTYAADYYCPTRHACVEDDLRASLLDAAQYCEQILETESIMSSNPESETFRSSSVRLECRASSTESNGPPNQIISLPSSNSTGRSHSFAFPILTREWPESPTRIGGDRRRRLVTADEQRELLKTPRWKSLVCCKSVK